MLGSIVIAWNNMEAIIREVLIQIRGLSRETRLSVLDMVSEAVSIALKDESKIHPSEIVRSELKFLSSKLDFARPYRNDYIHGVTYTGHNDDRKMGIRVLNFRNKEGVIRKQDQVIDPYDMYLVEEYMNLLSSYAFEFYSMLSLNRIKGNPFCKLERPVLPELHPRQFRKPR